MKKRPKVLTIAGFDPSGGAGLVADTKTFENLKCYGLAVCTANTIQNDSTFKACYWTPITQIKEQITILFDRFEIDFVKIGIVENWQVLNEIVDFLRQNNPTIYIVVDPVLKSSSDFEFHTTDGSIDAILEKIDLITPNYNEIHVLYPNLTVQEAADFIASKTNLFLKGGHRLDKKGQDKLFTKTGSKFVFNPKQKNVSEKHGSGCVLSASITAYIALGYPLQKACYRGKKYTEQFLCSTPNLLGYHK